MTVYNNWREMCADLAMERDTYKQLLKVAEDGMEKLRKENAELKALCEKQTRQGRVLAAVSLRLDQVTEERDALRAKLEGMDG